MAARAVSFLAALFVLFGLTCAPAQAQSVQCLQTPAVGTSNTTCANTAFVTKSIAAGAPASSIDAGGATAVTNGTNGNCLFDNVGVVGRIACGGALFQGRLTLASGVPVMGTTSCGGSACTSQGAIYYDCYAGTSVTYYNGTADSGEAIPGCEASTALQTSGTGVINANDVFDVWWVHSGANRLCVATNNSGAGWSGDTGGSLTARGTGYTQLNRAARGYPTNANAIAHCFNGSTDYGSVAANQASYLGTFCTTSSAGKVSFFFGGSASGGSAAVFCLWNFYNRASFAANVNDTGGSYTYASSTVRQARASAGNEVQFVFGVPEDSIQVNYFEWIATANVANAQPESGIGLDSTNSFSCNPSFVFASSNLNYAISTAAPCNLTPGAGLHTVSANEKSDGANANIYQDNSISTLSASLRM